MVYFLVQRVGNILQEHWMRTVLCKCQLLLFFPLVNIFGLVLGGTPYHREMQKFLRNLLRLTNEYSHKSFNWLVPAYIRIAETTCKISLWLLLSITCGCSQLMRLIFALYILLVMLGPMWGGICMYLGNDEAHILFVCSLFRYLITLRDLKEQKQ